MNGLVQIEQREDLGFVVSSRTVAEELGKQHKHVLESIHKLMIESTANTSTLFLLSEYQASNGKMNKEYLLTKDGFTLYMFNIQGHQEFKMAYINRFNEMEKAIQENHIKLPSNPMEVLELVFQANKQTDERVNKVEADVLDLKENTKLDAGEYGVIGKRVGKKVQETIVNYNLVNRKEVRSELYKELNGSINKVANVSSRSQLKQKHFDLVLNFINDWTPSSVTLHITRQMKLEEV